jgi:hypothetical protein
MQAHRCLVIIQSFNLLLSLTNAGLKGGHLHDPQHISDKVQIIYFSCIISYLHCVTLVFISCIS